MRAITGLRARPQDYPKPAVNPFFGYCVQSCLADMLNLSQPHSTGGKMSKQLRSERSVSNEQRYAPRYALRFATNTSVGNREFEVHVMSISHTGISLKAPVELAVGTNVSISLDLDNRISAEVVWSDGTISGCSFEKPLPKSVLSAVRLKGYALGTETFALGAPNPSSMLVDQAARWPGMARLATLLVASAASWALVVLAAALIL
jgi:hypothetical protein